MEERKGLSEELAEIKELLKEKNKSKSFKLPLKARLSKYKLKNGYVIVQVLNENKSVEFRKEPIIDGTIRLDDTYHAVTDLDIFFYKNKPFIMQPKSKNNPANPFRPLDGQKETYGQKYIMARMFSDEIKANKRKISGMAIIILIVAAIVGFYFISRGGFT